MNNFQKVLNKLHLTIPEAATKLGISETYAYKLSNGEREISKKLAEKMYILYSVNMEYLLFNTGEMFNPIKNEANPISAGSSNERITKNGNEFIDIGHGQYIMVIPLVEEYAYAGFLSGFADKEYVKELPSHSIVVRQIHSGKYFSFKVVGDSMNNHSDESISHGDIVTARVIDREAWKSRFHIHKFLDYVIVHKEGILIKRLIAHDVENGIITCRSLNPDKDKYPDFEINLNEVSQMMNIVNVSKSRYTNYM